MIDSNSLILLKEKGLKFTYIKDRLPGFIKHHLIIQLDNDWSVSLIYGKITQNLLELAVSHQDKLDYSNNPITTDVKRYTENEIKQLMEDLETLKEFATNWKNHLPSSLT